LETLMKRVLPLAVCVVVAFTACSKKAADSAAPGTQAAAPAAGGPAPAEAAKSAEPRKLEITEALVLKYMEYQKENLALVQQFVAETRKNLESAKGDTVKTLNQISLNDKMSKELDEKLKARRQAMGFSEDEFDMMQDAVQTMATGRALYNQMGGDAQMAKIEAEQKASLARVPADQRAAAEAQIADMSKSLAEMKNGAEVRKKYGDQAADVLLKHADDLAKVYWEGLQALGGKK
jgi:type III secretory pathway component EscV